MTVAPWRRLQLSQGMVKFCPLSLPVMRFNVEPEAAERVIDQES